MPVLVPHDEDLAMIEDPLMYWNLVALDMNRLGHSVGAPQGGPPLSARALAIVHLAIHDAYFSLFERQGDHTQHDLYLGKTIAPLPDATKALPTRVIAGAAFRALQLLYLPPDSSSTQDSLGHAQMESMLNSSLANAIPGNPHAWDDFRYGRRVADAMVEHLRIGPDEPGADAIDADGTPYIPKGGRGYFRADPGNPIVTPVRMEPEYDGSPKLHAARDYHAPFYGKTARRIAVQKPHYCAKPPNPIPQDPDYMEAFNDVLARGGAAHLPTTSRTAYETVAGLYWAYDGAILLGTPPRLYNRIVRRIAWEREQTNPAQRTATFVRLFALVNAAMADAGIIAWQEKYRHEYWRPLTGVREHDTSGGPSGTAGASTDVSGDPGWMTLGAPRTNTHNISFKPPFPAYPSGHATFGAAAFQIVRRFYLDGEPGFDPRGDDNIAFDFVSEELDGHSRELYQSYDPERSIDDQPGLVRTRVNRHFNSLWQAIHENGASRVYLGVHWVFDAFAATDVKDPNAHSSRPGVIPHRPYQAIRYEAMGPTEVGDATMMAPIGGVPLGLDIADDIFDSGLRMPTADVRPAREPAAEQPSQRVILVKQTDTNIR